MFEGREQAPTRSPQKHKPAPLDVRSRQPGLGQSQSDLGLRFYGLNGGLNVPRLDTSVSSRNGLFKNHENNLNSPPLSPVRGRGINRTPSPIKHMDEIKEGSAYKPKDIIKRSRSPIKKIFGQSGLLGRSGSSNQLPNDTVLKNGVKSWFGKVKQRMGESVSIPFAQTPYNPDTTCSLSIFPRLYIMSLLPRATSQLNLRFRWTPQRRRSYIRRSSS